MLRDTLFFFGIVAAIVFGTVWLTRRWRAVLAIKRLRQACSAFHDHRKRLEVDFLQQAGSSGRPRGLEWVSVEFGEEVHFARDRETSQLRALVGATVRFAAIVGGDMEDVEAVGNLRAATAIFYFNKGQWATRGQTVFNLSPQETVQHFRHELEDIKST